MIYFIVFCLHEIFIFIYLCVRKENLFFFKVVLSVCRHPRDELSVEKMVDILKHEEFTL
jgi:hypothetical protein